MNFASSSSRHGRDVATNDFTRRQISSILIGRTRPLDPLDQIRIKVLRESFFRVSQMVVRTRSWRELKERAKRRKYEKAVEREREKGGTKER